MEKTTRLVSQETDMSVSYPKDRGWVYRRAVRLVSVTPLADA